MSLPADPPRRRILYIRHRRSVDIAEAFRANQDEWFETMSMLADVTLADQDFDLGQTCDGIRPDFILYESPFFYAAPLHVENPGAHPHIPRIGLQIQDPYSSARVNFLRMMERLNIRWMFTHMTETALRQSPETAACTFSVSLLFDDKIFHDYGMPKDIPVSVFGGFLLPEIYDWRAATARAISSHFPTLVYTHPGYKLPVPHSKFAVTGEKYARMLNQSYFSMADSTIFDCLVRKHLEIPASGAVLVAPDAPVLKPYGFRDMENCILGSGNELFGKIATVADDPALYEKIRKAGYDLVHARYSRQQWRGILDFYECLRNSKPGETIQQQGMLGPFKAVASGPAPLPAIKTELADSPVSILRKELMHRILDREALKEPFQRPDWIEHTIEPLLPIGIAALLQGDVAQAQKYLLTPQAVRLKQSGFADWDPEEIAWLSLTASLTGDGALLNMTRQESASMRHLGLRRLQWLGKVLAAGGDASNPPPEVLQRAPDDQTSIHWTGQIEIADWLGLIARILDANGQRGVLRPASPLDSRKA